jgi:hypothetical protein
MHILLDKVKVLHGYNIALTQPRKQPISMGFLAQNPIGDPGTSV